MRARTRACAAQRPAIEPTSPHLLSPAATDTTAPAVTLSMDAVTNDTTPTISGYAGLDANDLGTVTVRIYSGSTVTGALLPSISTSRLLGGLYMTEALALAPGTYTARAEQSDVAGNVGRSSAVTFTITGTSDLTAPVVSLSAVATPSADTTPTFAGTGGAAAGDGASVLVRVFSGSTVSGTLVQSVSVSRSAGGSYSVDASALAPGTYTARTEQSDAAGNVGYSSPVTFTIASAADVTAPVVSLTWPATEAPSRTPRRTSVECPAISPAIRRR